MDTNKQTDGPNEEGLEEVRDDFPLDSQDIVLPTPDIYEKAAEAEHYKPGFFTRVSEFLANDIAAGMLLVVAALAALFMANSPWRDFYAHISHAEWGIKFFPEGSSLENFNLFMGTSHWASDGILVLFFFVVGLELKNEFSIGSLRDPKTAALPIIAAIFGMIGPAVIYLAIILPSGSEAWHGWAIPTATDIAFAVAILQIFGRGLPKAARIFLLTLAVADDLGGIIIIAIFFASGFDILAFAAMIVCVAAFGALSYTRKYKWWLLLPLGVLAWYFMHAAGIHATIAGVALGMVVPARERPGEHESLTERFARYTNPISAGLAVPVFAFFAAGVNIVDSPGGPVGMMTHPVALAIMIALPIGKLLGIFGSVALFTKVFRLRLGDGVTLADVVPISLIAGIGFTVALLISHLSFKNDELLTQAGSLGVVMGSFVSIILGAIALRVRIGYLRRQQESCTGIV